MLSQPKILIVDDDPDNRLVLRRILEPQGYSISEAADGSAALAGLEGQGELPDIVLLDVNMPERDGFSVCAAIKGHPRSRLIPVVMITALDGREERLKAMSLGADEFLSKPFDVTELTVRVRALLALKSYTDELEHVTHVLEGMAKVIQTRDRQTGDHCGRVGEISVKIAGVMGLGADDMINLRLGGLLHDIGKIGIPDAILGKPGRLNAEEFEVIKSHSVIGAKLIAPMKTLAGALPLVRHHHERLDGSGYPDGLAGSAISMPVRILSVADIYDVLSSKRPYKEPLPGKDSLQILREEAEKGWWDKEVIGVLSKIVS